MKIIANMIVKNEADNYLPQVLDRLVEQVDIITITDDCSTDRTVDLCREYTPHVNVLPQSIFSIHEGKLRQNSWDYLIAAAEPREGDWILAIDADEELYETTHTLREIPELGPQVANIEFYHMWNETHYRVDKAWRPHGSFRYFRYQHNGRFADKKLAPGSEPTFVQFNARYYRGNFLQESGLKMKHLSYIKDEDKKIKYDRYMEIDGGAFHSNNHILSIMDQNPDLKEWVW